MKEFEKHFLTNHYFRSQAPNWHKIYLSTREARMTHLLRDRLGNDFWNNYAEVIEKYFYSGQLLFRAKLITADAVLVAQIWRDKAAAQAFAEEAYREASPIELLPKYGFRIEEKNSEIASDEIPELIKNYMLLPHILQYVNDRYKTPGMITGDPMKLGNGKLPFPDSVN